jgi:hypothetical protein
MLVMGETEMTFMRHVDKVKLIDKYQTACVRERLNISELNKRTETGLISIDEL